MKLEGEGWDQAALRAAIRVEAQRRAKDVARVCHNPAIDEHEYGYWVDASVWVPREAVAVDDA
jgi:hypothetical protein